MDSLLGNGSINTFPPRQVLGKQAVARQSLQQYATTVDVHCYVMDVFSVRSDPRLYNWLE
jgi:hypothetical protein